MKTIYLALCLATGLLAAAAPVAAAVNTESIEPLRVETQVEVGQTVVSFQLAEKSAGLETTATLHRLVALPPNTKQCDVELLSGNAKRITLTGGIQRLRGLPVISLVIEDPGAGELQVAVHHDGNWENDSGDPRLRSRGFSAAVGGSVLGVPGTKSMVNAGSYVIITAPGYITAANNLADWKQRKGFPVVVTSTDVIGTANTAIKGYLQNAYDTWADPPEYVVLIGDTEDIPTWYISQNPTDQEYAFLDGEDWLPDVMLGRICVESDYQAGTVVNKTISYERSPYLVNPDWFTKSLVVGANYPAQTPVATVRWCGEQLETLGFAPAEAVTYDPFDPSTPNIWDGVEPITNALEAGVSMVMYRGWAYGTAGWEPPHFIDVDIPQVENGAMTPLVFSFVCLNGNYTADNPCFGEVFLRQGSPTESKGAVAFYGNGEHWSHTRYNDAMAITMFERIVDPAITDLGSWIAAGKLRFMDYFPMEMSAEEFDEESVEFYFKIYNLLGDPELNLWKATPTPISVSHTATIPPGANYLELNVSEGDGITPLADARVGIVQSGRLLGSSYSDGSGLAQVLLSEPPVTGTPIDVTVTHFDRLPYEGSLAAGDGSTAYLVATSHSLNDDGTPPSNGNGDGSLNPGESVEVLVTVSNQGSTIASTITSTMSIDGPATPTQSSVDFPDIPGGQDASANNPFVLQVDPAALDGAASDTSQFVLTVKAPQLIMESYSVQPDSFLAQGQDVTFALNLRNQGRARTTGGTALLTLNTPGVGTVTDNSAVIGAMGPGEPVDTSSDPFALHIDDNVAAGTGLSFTMQVTTNEGYQLETTFSLLVGQLNIGAPVGPDGYGYYAYDSADFDYPDQRPVYRWHELSPTFGGPGTEIEFGIGGVPLDELVVIVDLPFPFQFYGQTYQQARVSDNGFITFDLDDEIHFYNWTIPSPHGNHSIVAPFWDNFHPNPEDETRLRPDGVFAYHDSLAGTYTIEWSRVSHYMVDIDDLQTFQVVLFDPAVHTPPTGDADILFLYKQVNNNDHLRTWATVGIESPTEEHGIQFSYSNIYAMGAAPLSPGLAIRFTRESPVYSPLTLASFKAEPTASGLQLSWSPNDNRPVVGWLVYRVEEDKSSLLTEQPLPASARSFLDTGEATHQSCSYLVTALHPFGQKTKMGPYNATPVPAGSRTLALHPCWPNPVKDVTQIGFSLPQSGSVRLRIYDVAGRLIRTLVDESLPQGEINMIWDGRDDTGHAAAGGVYFYRLEAGGDVQTRKMLLLH